MLGMSIAFQGDMGQRPTNAQGLVQGLPLVLLLALAWPQPSAVAEASPTLPASVLDAEQRHERVTAHQRRLESVLAQLSERIARLKRQQQGLQRDAQLQQSLREAQSVAARLDALQQGPAKLARTALEQAYRRALAGPLSGVALRARLLEGQARLRATASKAPTRIVLGVSAGPLDCADDLETKADLLRDSADKVERELKAVRGQLATLERRATLQRHQAAASSDLFLEEAPRWVAQARSTVSAIAAPEASATRNDTGSSGADVAAPGQPAYGRPDRAEGTAGVTAAGGLYDASGETFVLGAGGAATPGSTGGGYSGTAATPKGGDGPRAEASVGGAPATPPTLVTTTTVTLASVLDPATLRELQQALRSGNAGAHADALRRAAQRLEQLALRLKQQAQALRREADQERRAP